MSKVKSMHYAAAAKSMAVEGSPAEFLASTPTADDEAPPQVVEMSMASASGFNGNVFDVFLICLFFYFNLLINNINIYYVLILWFLP